MFQIHLFRNHVINRTVTFYVTIVSNSYTKKMGKCFFVTLACNKLFSTLGTEVINQREHEKQFRNQILKKNFFTLPGLESEVWQEVRLRPSIHTTCQNLTRKKNASDYWFDFNFFRLVRFWILLLLTITSRW